MGKEVIEKIAYEQATKLSQSKRSVAANLGSFSKYTGDTAPDAFVATFENESAVCGITEEADMVKIFPSLITGPKSTAA